MDISRIEFCVYDPGRHCMIDVINPDTGRTLYGNKEPFSVGEIWGFLEAIEHNENCLIRPPEEITEEKYVEMLEVLPPLDWVQRQVESSFKLSEFTSGQITAIYCRLGDRYFELSDRCSLSHSEIVAKCKTALSQKVNP